MVSFVDWIIPDSLSDFGAILFWVLSIILLIIIIIDIYTFLSYRKASKTIEQPTQNLNPLEPMEKPEGDQSRDIVEIRNQVDRLIEMNKL
jgi:hypothetical protein